MDEMFDKGPKDLDMYRKHSMVKIATSVRNLKSHKQPSDTCEVQLPLSKVPETIEFSGCFILKVSTVKVKADQLSNVQK